METPWAIIDDYVCKAYKTAKAALPNAKMYYNDYKHAATLGRYEAKSNSVFKLVKDLKDRNCGVDGVGFQSHVDLNYADENYAAITGNIKRYAKLGVEVAFTEVDVRCN